MVYTHLWEQLPWWDTFLCCWSYCVVCGVCVCEVWWVGARIARIEVLAQTIRRANGLWDVARIMCVLVGYTTLHLLFSLTIVKQV